MTVPPCPDNRKEPRELLASAKVSFFKGDYPAAYRSLLLSESLSKESEWRKIFFLTLVGLDRPVDAASAILAEEDSSEDELSWCGLLLKREGFTRAYPAFKPEPTYGQIPREIAKKAISISENRDNLFILTPTALYKYSFSGEAVSTTSISEAKELMGNGDEDPIVLTSSSIICESKRTPLPLKIKNAASFARGNGDSFYILDGEGGVFLVDQSGSIIEERKLLIGKPIKIRTDELFRVFILSGKDKEVAVYGASFEPLFVLAPRNRDVSAGNIRHFDVDYFGNTLLLDKGKKELFFFNFRKDFLGKSCNKTARIDLFYWDGGDSFLALDMKSGRVFKAAI